MKFLVDECLSPSYVARLAERGHFDAIHPSYIGLVGVRDDTIVARALTDDRVIVTSNARDYRKLLAGIPIHPGAIVVEQLNRERSWAFIALALDYIELQLQPDDYMINRVIEVSVAGGVRPYTLPTSEDDS